jgi:hypothetical protein
MNSGCELRVQADMFGFCVIPWSSPSRDANEIKQKSCLQAIAFHLILSIFLYISLSIPFSVIQTVYQLTQLIYLPFLIPFA